MGAEILLAIPAAVVVAGSGWLFGAAWRSERTDRAEQALRECQEAYGDLRVEVERLTVRTQQDIPSASGAHRHRLRFPTGSCIRPVRPGVQRAIREIETMTGEGR